MSTKADVVAAMSVTVAIGEAIRELGQVPSGQLYAQLMSKLSFEAYSGAIEVLQRANLIKQTTSFMLVWIGPEGRRESGS
jgi:hypothetical protein